ncbi:MAG: glycoside hydrolase family 18 protein, partial [Legionellales bacterium]|nr:glycoside hydrolase family 18 protein [Legionellales bacterium]
YLPAKLSIYADQQDVIHIANNTKKPIVLNHAQLTFYYHGNIKSLAFPQGSLKLVKHTVTPNLPNSMGDFYTYAIHSDKSIVLKPQATFDISVEGISSSKEPVHGLTLSTETLIPVQAQFSSSTSEGNTTISICNNSPYSIPLTNIELDFNYEGNITSIWGSPWLAWEATSNNGQYTLVGGTPYSPDYAPDPTCKTPITVEFNATPGTPAPTGFVLKAAGGTPIGYGTLDIHLQNAPQTGLINPTISIDGMGIHQQQSVEWGHDLVVPSLVPGNYTVSASPTDDGTTYYQSTVEPSSVELLNNQTIPVAVSYQAVPTGTVTVTLNNAPASNEPVTFNGAHASYVKTVSANSTVILPQDDYVITSSVPGYSALISPSTIHLMQSAAVNITYSQIKEQNYVGYFETWSDAWAADAAHTELAQVPTYINYVMLSFMKPDAKYVAGSLDFTDTGLQFGYSGQMLKDAVNALKTANPNVKIILSVGGATYPNWDSLNTQAIVDIVKDFGLDGVDIDYEVDPGCSVGTDKLVHCTIDQKYAAIVTALRQALPRPYQVTIAGWSTGAYGEDQWVNAPPGGSHTGEMLPLLRTNGQDLDMINVMSYDAGTSFDPNEALAAYQHYFNGAVAMGIEVPPEAWGGHVYTLPAVADLTSAVQESASKTGHPPGMMIWALQIDAKGTASPDNPSAEMMSVQICQQMGLGNCTQPWNL